MNVLYQTREAWTLLTLLPGVEPPSQDGGCEDSSSSLIGPQLHEARHLQVFCAISLPFYPQQPHVNPDSSVILSSDSPIILSSNPPMILGSDSSVIL